MLMAHPAVLRNLIDQYEQLKHVEDGDSEARQRLDDVAYTLCVSTGTRDIETGLIAARQQLSGAHPQADSLFTSCT